MSDSESKENVLRIMDDLLEHLNKTKKLFMILIFASFIIAPLSIVFTIVILTPSFVTHAGQPYDVSIVARPPGDLPEIGLHKQMEEEEFYSNFIEGKPLQGMHIVQRQVGSEGEIFIIKGISVSQGNQTLMINDSNIGFRYVPANQFDHEIPPMHPSPKFMFVGGMDPIGRQTDVTMLIMVVVGISAGLAATWLILGIKEYAFFAKWNVRYSKYKKLQENVNKELEDN